MDTQTIISEIKDVLGNLNFPAYKQDVVNHAELQGATQDTTNTLQQLPDQQYGSMGELLSKLPGVGSIEGEVEKFL